MSKLSLTPNHRTRNARFDVRCRGSVPGKLMFLARFDYGLCLQIVDSAAFSQETKKQQYSTPLSNGPPTVSHIAPNSKKVQPSRRGH